MKESDIHIIRKEKCSLGYFTLRSDKIIMYKPFDWVETAHVEDLKEQYEICMDITGGVPHLLYSDNSNMKSFGSEERVYMSSVFHHFASACAIKENSAITRFIIHTALYLNKPQLPLKMFKTETDAINWLKSLN